MSKPTITIEDIIAYLEDLARHRDGMVWYYTKYHDTDEAEKSRKAAAAHREAAALLRKGLDE